MEPEKNEASTTGTPRDPNVASAPTCAYDHLRAVDPSLYEELRVIAARALRGESRTLAPGTTSLVHEIWLRLARSDRNPVNDQQHLLALASLVARRPSSTTLVCALQIDAAAMCGSNSFLPNLRAHRQTQVPSLRSMSC